MVDEEFIWVPTSCSTVTLRCTAESLDVDIAYSVDLQPKSGVMSGPKRLRQAGFVSQLTERGV